MRPQSDRGRAWTRRYVSSPLLAAQWGKTSWSVIAARVGPPGVLKRFLHFITVIITPCADKRVPLVPSTEVSAYLHPACTKVTSSTMCSTWGKYGTADAKP